MAHNISRNLWTFSFSPVFFFSVCFQEVSDTMVCGVNSPVRNWEIPCTTSLFIETILKNQVPGQRSYWFKLTYKECLYKEDCMRLASTVRSLKCDASYLGKRKQINKRKPTASLLWHKMSEQGYVGGFGYKSLRGQETRAHCSLSKLNIAQWEHNHIILDNTDYL